MHSLFQTPPHIYTKDILPDLNIEYNMNELIIESCCCRFSCGIWKLSGSIWWRSTFAGTTSILFRSWSLVMWPLLFLWVICILGFFFCYVYRELKFSILFIFEKFIERTRGRCFISHHGQLLAYNLVVINNIAD